MIFVPSDQVRRSGQVRSARTLGTRRSVGCSPRGVCAGEVDISRCAVRCLQVPWRKVLTNKPFLAVFIAHAGWGFGHTIYYAWLPNFYYTEYGLPISDSAWLSALPWVCTVLVTNAGGFFADKLVNDGVMSRLKSRRIMQVRSPPLSRHQQVTPHHAVPWRWLAEGCIMKCMAVLCAVD